MRGKLAEASQTWGPAQFLSPTRTGPKESMTTSTSRSHVGRRPTPNGRSVATAQDVTRHVPTNIQCLLWGRAAGRCEFAGCNRPLWKSTVTQEPVNIGQKAHIYSFSSDGPRGNAGIPSDQLNGLANLMLVCHQCHQKIDAEARRRTVHHGAAQRNESRARGSAIELVLGSRRRRRATSCSTGRTSASTVRRSIIKRQRRLCSRTATRRPTRRSN